VREGEKIKDDELSQNRTRSTKIILAPKKKIQSWSGHSDDTMMKFIRHMGVLTSEKKGHCTLHKIKKKTKKSKDKRKINLLNLML